MLKLAKDLKKDDNVKLADTTCQIVRTLENQHGEIIVHLSVPNLTSPRRKKDDHNAMMIVPKKFEFKVVEEHFVT